MQQGAGHLTVAPYTLVLKPGATSSSTSSMVISKWRFSARAALLSDRPSTSAPGNVRELEHALSHGVIRALSQGQRKEDVIEFGVAWSLSA